MKLLIMLSVTLFFNYSFAVIRPIVTTTGTDTFGSGIIKVTVPGNFSCVLNDGSKDPANNISTEGMSQWYDLKNDPQEKHDLAGMCCGMYQYEWYFQPENLEHCPSPGSVSVIEANAVRAVIKYSYILRPYGSKDYPVSTRFDSIQQVFAIYAPDKSYQTLKMKNISGSDVTFILMQYGLLNSWCRFSGEAKYFYTWPSGGYEPKTPSPWSFVYEAANNDYRGPNYQGNHYILHADSLGHTVTLAGDTIPVYANFLEILKEDRGNYDSHRAQLFLGVRSHINTNGGTVIPNGSTFIRHCVLFGGDNGINNRDTANTYVAEYCSSATPVMVKGTTTGFNPEYGCYDLTAAADSASFSLTGILHNPAFSITSWNRAVPATIKVNGSTLKNDTDYIAVAGSGRLLLQVMKVYKGSPSTQFEVFGDDTPTPVVAVSNPLVFETALSANARHLSMEINYQVADKGMVNVSVYDLAGRTIKQLVSGMQAAGKYRATWNGRNENGISVQSGVYVAVLKAGKTSIAQTIPVIK